MKDYYIVLGVPRMESLEGIQQAFRELAKRYHPDRVGSGGTSRFQEITEAYETLSSPQRRADYDRRLRLEETRGRYARGPEPLVSRGKPPPEPLIPEPVSVVDDFDVVRPSLEALFDRIVRNFSGTGIPKSEHAEPLDVYLDVSARQAARGGTVEIGVPVLFHCPFCGGSGRDWGFPCRACDQRGRVLRDEPIRVTIPAGVRDGQVVERSLSALGIDNLYLRIHVLVEP